MVFKGQKAGRNDRLSFVGVGFHFAIIKCQKAASYLLTLRAQDFTKGEHNWHQAILPVINNNKKKSRVTYDISVRILSGALTLNSVVKTHCTETTRLVC